MWLLVCGLGKLRLFWSQAFKSTLWICGGLCLQMVESELTKPRVAWLCLVAMCFVLKSVFYPKRSDKSFSFSTRVWGSCQVVTVIAKRLQIKQSFFSMEVPASQRSAHCIFNQTNSPFSCQPLLFCSSYTCFPLPLPLPLSLSLCPGEKAGAQQVKKPQPVSENSSAAHSIGSTQSTPCSSSSTA